MTKAKSKAARRKLKRAITLAGGRSVPQPATQGRRIDREPQEAADVVALTARARRTGCTVEEARDVLAGEPMGCCIMAMRPGVEDRRALLGVWQGISAAWANYCARYLGRAATPQAAALPMLPEPMQTDQSLRVDLRTGDERDAAARRVWEEWRAAFNALPVDQALILTSAVYGKGPALWNEDARQPTRHGAIAVKALSALHQTRN